MLRPMRGALWLLLALTCACATRVAPAELGALQQEVQTRNDAAYERALVSAGYERAPPPGPQEVFDGAGEGADDSVYVTGNWNESDPQGPRAADFATDQRGALWHIQRRPQISKADKVIVKGCRETYSGGAAPAIYEVGYRLPAGVRVAGIKTIEFPAEALAVQFKKGKCKQGPPRP